MLRTLFLTIALFASPAMASPLQDLVEAQEAENKGDFQTATRLWHSLAERNYVPAQIHLGLMYREGRGVFQSHKEADHWFRRAAENGHVLAQNHLGFMYYEGLRVPQDYAQALFWFRRSAEQGQVDAQRVLGLMYAQSQGVPLDHVEAHKWFNLAASRESDTRSRESLMSLRDLMARQMTPVQIAEAQRRAREWRPRPE